MTKKAPATLRNRGRAIAKNPNNKIKTKINALQYTLQNFNIQYLM